jgi:plastocyanin
MMRILLTAVTVAALAGCSGSYSPTGPTSNGGPMGGGAGGGATPSTLVVDVGNNFFKSARNGSVNLAVDTVAAGGTVTWQWTNSGAVSHSIRSQGSPSFTSSAILAGNGTTHQITFPTAGTYRYDCAVHGAAMSGIVVVQ